KNPSTTTVETIDKERTSRFSRLAGLGRIRRLNCAARALGNLAHTREESKSGNDGTRSVPATSRNRLLLIRQRPLIRKPMNRLHALRQRLQQRAAPASGRIGRDALVRLLIRLGKEPHRAIVAADDILADRDAKLHVAARLLLLHRIEMK